MKLPDITYSRVAPGRTLSPQAAVAKHRTQQNVWGALGELGSVVAEQKQEADLIRANANYRQSVVDFQEWAAANPTATKEQLDAWAADNLGDNTVFDSIDISEFEDRGETALPQHKWYLQGLSAVMERGREAGGENILNPGVRTKWIREVDKVNSEEMLRATQQSAASAVKYEVNRLKTLTELAIEQGKFEEANEYLSASMWDNNPALRDSLKYKAAAEEERNNLSARSSTLDEEALDDFIDDMLDPEYRESSVLRGDELDQWAKTASVNKSKIQTQVDKARGEAEDRLAAGVLTAIENNEITLPEIQRMRGRLGWSNYKYLTTQFNSNAADVRSMKSEGTALAEFERKLTQLQAGQFGGDSYYAELDNLYSRLNRDTMSLDDDGNVIGTINWTDAATIRGRITALKEAPMKNPAITRMRKRAHLEILGYAETDDWGDKATLIDPDRQAAYVDAMGDLDEYVMQMGPEADLGFWQQYHLPLFIEDKAQRARQAFPSRVNAYRISTADGLVDTEQTNRALAEKLKTLQPGSYEYEILTRDIVRFNEWRNQYGQ
jgi:hypothetical protein